MLSHAITHAYLPATGSASQPAKGHHEISRFPACQARTCCRSAQTSPAYNTQSARVGSSGTNYLSSPAYDTQSGLSIYHSGSTCGQATRILLFACRGLAFQ